jgi:hypothetical protein
MNKRQYSALVSEHMNLTNEQQLALEYWCTVGYFHNEGSFDKWEALSLCPADARDLIDAHAPFFNEHYGINMKSYKASKIELLAINEISRWHCDRYVEPVQQAA